MGRRGDRVGYFRLQERNRYPSDPRDMADVRAGRLTRSQLDEAILEAMHAHHQLFGRDPKPMTAAEVHEIVAQSRTGVGSASRVRAALYRILERENSPLEKTPTGNVLRCHLKWQEEVNANSDQWEIRDGIMHCKVCGEIPERHHFQDLRPYLKCGCPVPEEGEQNG